MLQVIENQYVICCVDFVIQYCISDFGLFSRILELLFKIIELIIKYSQKKKYPDAFPSQMSLNLLDSFYNLENLDAELPQQY